MTKSRWPGAAAALSILSLVACDVANSPQQNGAAPDTAVKPAAAGGGPLAVWATPATTASPYQRRLIREFAAGTPATPVPCHGLADAIERADDAAIDAALAAAAALTPPDTRALVLGCTHYELVADRIRSHLPAAADRPVALHGSATAVGMLR